MSRIRNDKAYNFLNNGVRKRLVVFSSMNGTVPSVLVRVSRSELAAGRTLEGKKPAAKKCILFKYCGAQSTDFVVARGHARTESKRRVMYFFPSVRRAQTTRNTGVLVRCTRPIVSRSIAPVTEIRRSRFKNTYVHAIRPSFNGGRFFLLWRSSVRNHCTHGGRANRKWSQRRIRPRLVIPYDR